MTIALAIIMAGACAWATGSEADAEAPAQLYFFAGSDCTAQIYLLPDEPIGDKIPELPGWADCWADETGHRITPQSTFSGGAHTITAWAGEPVPKAESGKDPGRTAIQWGVPILALAVIIGAIYLHRRRH